MDVWLFPTISHVEIWNHPIKTTIKNIETTIKKWLFRVPGSKEVFAEGACVVLEKGLPEGMEKGTSAGNFGSNSWYRTRAGLRKPSNRSLYKLSSCKLCRVHLSGHAFKNGTCADLWFFLWTLEKRYFMSQTWCFFFEQQRPGIIKLPGFGRIKPSKCMVILSDFPLIVRVGFISWPLKTCNYEDRTTSANNIIRAHRLRLRCLASLLVWSSDLEMSGNGRQTSDRTWTRPFSCSFFKAPNKRKWPNNFR